MQENTSVYNFALSFIDVPIVVSYISLELWSRLFSFNKDIHADIPKCSTSYSICG